ncbi:MAG: hypothetical protein IRY99_15550 [Isosphaeraceae bacterium]|nr:hypothetical protein [Isosphaeraceae bacterium]
MMCKVVKKGVLGAALGAGALALLFGTAAPSYIKTACHKLRHSAKERVPVPFEIDRARQQLADLKPAIDRCTEEVARAEYRVEKLDREILAARAGIEREKKELIALRQTLDTGTYQLTGGTTYSDKDLKRELAFKLDRYKDHKKILAEKEETLRLRKQAVQAAREKLDNMKAAQVALLSKIEAIEAKFRQVEANQAASEIGIDDSALAQVKQTVAELEERVEVMRRVADQNARFSDSGLAIETPGRDIVKEVDEELGCCQEDDAACPAGERNL